MLPQLYPLSVDRCEEAASVPGRLAGGVDVCLLLQHRSIPRCMESVRDGSYNNTRGGWR
jgi:hypothetical protein